MTNRRFDGYEKEYQNLLKANISAGRWIDAGCGRGAYTIPLSGLVDSVLAIDQNTSKLSNLQNKLELLEITNIELKHADFRNKLVLTDGDFDGVLFTFSLHYASNLLFLTEFLEQKVQQRNFKIIIIEYTRTIPVPWVPYPCPPNKIEKLVEALDIYEIDNKYQNNRYYIIEIKNINSMLGQI